eukprot:TRINITY_DN13471_c0_g1_i1.p1 TRINITY_DN13471_c0_g1~~TRINITY_DN13471_c0_g1_i1.p1  ORF type:complete len:293 (+),score=65.00 TRINITY_DN13471_c0_g1_i1:35-880(+)
MATKKRVRIDDGGLGDETDAQRSRVDPEMQKPSEKGARMSAKEIKGQEDLQGPEFEGDTRMEPFNLKQELKDGYFDGSGAYIENRIERETKELADGWLEEYNEKFAAGKVALYVPKPTAAAMDEDSEDEGPTNVAALRKELISLLKDGETISQALRRTRPPKTGPGKKTPEQLQAVADHAELTKTFNRITEIADRLLAAGDGNIYEQNKNELEFEMQKAGAAAVMWEYRWKGKDEKYGPFPAQQMQAWANMGMFAAPVEVRCITRATAFRPYAPGLDFIKN